MKETQISRAIMDYLAARRVFAVRMNSGMRIGEHNGKKWAIHMNAPGTADILAFPEWERGVDDHGNWCSYAKIVPLWIEVKTEKGKQSDLQKSFQAQVEKQNHDYIIARGIDDVERALQGAGGRA